jgi:cytochrome P450
MASIAAPRAPFRFADAPMARDRAAGWAYFRSFGDVFEVEGDGFYVTSGEAVMYGLQHHELFSSGHAFDFAGSPFPMIPIATDPPDHARFRRVLDPMLSPRVMRTMEDSLREQVGTLIDSFVTRGSFDIVDDLARVYPSQVFLTLFGLPLEDRDQLIKWVEEANEHPVELGLNPDDDQKSVAGTLHEYQKSFIEAKRRNPGDDMLSKILAREGDDAWTEEEIFGFCYMFTLAGLDTVTAQIGFSFLYLARDAELRGRLVEDPELIAPFVEEIVRLEPPAPMPPRIAERDVELGGVTIPAGSKVYMVLACANRDPARHPLPDSVNLEGADRHLGFGAGIHRCVGSHIARTELRLVIEEFHKRIPDYELAPGADPQVVWPSATMHLVDLPLVLPAGGTP